MKTTIAFIAVAAAFVVSTMIAMVTPIEDSSTKIEMSCRIVRVVDGDTLDVQPISPVVRVRLEDCWAPELRAEGGDRSKAALEEFLAGKSTRVLVSIGPELRKSLTFGRVVGRVTADGKDVSQLMVDSGHATERKP